MCSLEKNNQNDVQNPYSKHKVEYRTKQKTASQVQTQSQCASRSQRAPNGDNAITMTHNLDTVLSCLIVTICCTLSSSRCGNPFPFSFGNQHIYYSIYFIYLHFIEQQHLFPPQKSPRTILLPLTRSRTHRQRIHSFIV